MKLHLRWKDVEGVRYYFAEWTEPGTTASGRVKRRWKALGVHGPISGRGAPGVRREAELKLAELERVQTARASDAREGMTVSEYMEQYIESASRSVRASTMLGYARICREFASFNQGMRLRQITHAHVEAYLRSLSAQKPSTINKTLRVMSTAFARAVDLDLIVRNPVKLVKPARIEERTFPPFITPELFSTTFLPCFRPRMRAAVCLAMYAGFRLGEVAALRWTDVDFEREELRIESRPEWQTKSGRGRVVPMLQPVRAALLALPRVSPFVVGHDESMPNPQGIGILWKEAVERRRIENPSLPPITFHGLRHSFATWLASSGLPIQSLRVLLGHASITTTMMYTHVQPHTVAEQVRVIASTLPSSDQIFTGVFTGDQAPNRPEMT